MIVFILHVWTVECFINVHHKTIDHYFVQSCFFFISSWSGMTSNKCIENDNAHAHAWTFHLLLICSCSYKRLGKDFPFPPGTLPDPEHLQSSRSHVPVANLILELLVLLESRSSNEQWNNQVGILPAPVDQPMSTMVSVEQYGDLIGQACLVDHVQQLTDQPVDHIHRPLVLGTAPPAGMPSRVHVGQIDECVAGLGTLVQLFEVPCGVPNGIGVTLLISTIQPWRTEEVEVDGPRDPHARDVPPPVPICERGRAYVGVLVLDLLPDAW